MSTDSSDPNKATPPPEGKPVRSKRIRIVRWKAVVPLALVVGGVLASFYLYLDTAVARAIEALGTQIVGARVDVEEADVRLRDGFVTIRGLQVTNPDAPMTNLVEAGELVADLRVLPLLEKKVFIDTLAVRDVRFGTPRETSGAIEEPSEASQAARSQVRAWGDNIQVPEFSLAGLGGSVNVSGIRPESLATIRSARQFGGSVDSAQSEWVNTLQRIDPGTTVDSARALLQRLEGASLRSLGVAGLAASARSARTAISGVTSMADTVRQLEASVRSGLGSLRTRVDALASDRAADLAYARGLLNIPSLDAPDLSPSLFGSFAISKIQPILYWLGQAERLLPPGLDPRRRPGPKRARASGQTITFPGEGSLPSFTLAYADVGLEIGGTGGTAGRYDAIVRGLTSSPTLLGAPLTVRAGREEAQVGPRSVALDLVLDHVTPVARDSLSLASRGFSLPAVTLPGLGATLDFGDGRSVLNLARRGDSISGSWVWSSTDVSWERLASAGEGRVARLIWGAVSSLQSAEVEVRIAGRLAAPRLAIRSNIGTEIASGLRRQLEGEIAEAERQLRAEVNRLVAQPVADAQARLDTVRGEVESRIATHRVALDEVKTQLEAKLRDLTRFLPPGIGEGNSR